MEENKRWDIKKGNSYYVTRNNSSIIAFHVGEELDNYSFHVVASHSDYPTFKIKENAEIEVRGKYTQINTEGYGGMICSTWFDRPLSVAGRALVKEGNALVSKLVNVDKDLLISAMDDEESAHLDVDDDYTMIVLDVPIYVNHIYETYPFVIIYNNDYYVTMCKKETKLLDLMVKKFKKIEPHKHVRLTLQLMYRIASQYISSLKYLNSKRQEIEKEIQSSIENKDLLSELSIGQQQVKKAKAYK